MTLVALTYSRDSFLAISDSRISWGSGSKLEKFTKLFSHRYNFTSGHPVAKPPRSYTGELGLAISGSTLFGLAFSNMFARTIAEMHSFDDAKPPTFGAFEKIADYCANVLTEYILSKDQCFEVLIFGFDPRTGKAMIIHLRLGPGEDGAEVTLKKQLAHEDEIVSIGTGAKHLPKDLPLPSQLPLSILVEKVISSNADPASGGDIQIMELCVDCARFFGTMVEGKSWDDATYYGIMRADLGDIDGFRVGRSNPVSLKPYSAISDLAHKKARHLKDKSSDVPEGLGNVGPMMSFLWVIHSKKSNGVLSGNLQLEKAFLISGQYYFAKVCSICWRNSPSILSPSEGEGFQGTLSGAGSVATSCQFCDNLITFGAADFQREVLWDNGSK
ncbi:hypothetical protein [Sulfitobacter pontiacus]|uniref:hypothetical protein n=1 Tax=Sulfitobacter pontiacus TaxID=60137 RepID=UPI00295EC639|nr:hypothetical protein [Sulfitobacter pontiacus]